MAQNAPKISTRNQLQTNFVKCSAPPSNLKSEIRLWLPLGLPRHQQKQTKEWHIKEFPPTPRPAKTIQKHSETHPTTSKPTQQPPHKFLFWGGGEGRGGSAGVFLTSLGVFWDRAERRASGGLGTDPSGPETSVPKTLHLVAVKLLG
jgi:hypothetical protein